jgi:hypothetical protein
MSSDIGGTMCLPSAPMDNIPPYVLRWPRRFLFLVGAGASYGNKGSNGLSRTAPLGDDLFAALKERSKHWRELPSKLASNFTRQKFEEAFEVWAHDEKLKSRLVWEAGRFFDEIRIIEPDKCAYSNLVDEILSRELLGCSVFASLNYDTVFEEAFHQRGIKTRYWGGGESQSVAWFVKPHGSSNFLPGRQNRIKILGGEYHPAPGAANDPGGYRCIKPGSSSTEYDSDDKLENEIIHPIMAHYNKDKTPHIGTKVINSLREEWKHYAKTAQKIIVIGVMPTASDSIIWDSLKEATGDVYFVNPSPDDRAEAKSIRPTLIEIPKGFAQAMSDIAEVLDQRPY